MASELGLMDRLALAFAVMARWETLLTLAAFVAIWLLLRYVADPWARENHAPRPSLKSLLARRPPRKPVAPPPEEHPSDEEDEFPED